MDFVTGATGFLGTPLTARLLAGGRSVRVLVRPSRREAWLPAGVQVVRADVCDAAALRAALRGCETVFHAAGKAHDLDAGEAELRRVNVDGTSALLAAARAAGVRTFLFLSSVKAIGEGGRSCVDEAEPARPTTPYGVTKLEAEGLALEEGRAGGMRVAILRLPLVYGEGLKGNLRAMLDAVRSGRFPPPPRVPNRRSLASAEDVVNASILAAGNDRAAGKTYFVTDGEIYSTRRIYDAMRAALGLPETRWALPRWAFRAAALAGDATSRLAARRMPFSSEQYEKLLGSACYRNDRIREELGFRPATSLEAALPGILEAERAAGAR